MNEYFYPTVGRCLKNIEIKIEKENPRDPYGLIKIYGNNVASSAYINGKEVGLSDRDGFLNTRDFGFFREKILLYWGVPTICSLLTVKIIFLMKLNHI